MDVDGQFGSGTEGAVKKFQKDNKLEDDGIVGKLTWTGLFGGSTGTPGGDAPGADSDGDTTPLSFMRRRDWEVFAHYAA